MKINKLGMIQAEKMENISLEIIGGDNILPGAVADFIRVAISDAGFDAAAS